MYIININIYKKSLLEFAKVIIKHIRDEKDIKYIKN